MSIRQVERTLIGSLTVSQENNYRLTMNVVACGLTRRDISYRFTLYLEISRTIIPQLTRQDTSTGTDDSNNECHGCNFAHSEKLDGTTQEGILFTVNVPEFVILWGTIQRFRHNKKGLFPTTTRNN